QGEEAKGRATGLAHAVADVVGAVMDLRIRGCAVGEVGVAVEVPVEIANEGKRGDGRQALMSKEFHDDLALAQGREASVAAVAARRHFQPALLLSGFQRQANLQGSQRKRFVLNEWKQDFPLAIGIRMPDDDGGDPAVMTLEIGDQLGIGEELELHRGGDRVEVGAVAALASRAGLAVDLADAIAPVLEGETDVPGGTVLVGPTLVSPFRGSPAVREPRGREREQNSMTESPRHVALHAEGLGPQSDIRLVKARIVQGDEAEKFRGHRGTPMRRPCDWKPSRGESAPHRSIAGWKVGAAVASSEFRLTLAPPTGAAPANLLRMRRPPAEPRGPSCKRLPRGRVDLSPIPRDAHA